MRFTMITIAFVLGAIVSSLTAEEASNVTKDQLNRDQIHIAVQKICPVSGQELGSHGKPIKVKIGEEVVFLCCKGCVNAKVDPKHWATIHRNFASAQQICPVMKHELPKNPKWTIVDGQIVFVCCPPCTEKIEAEPQAFLQQVDDLYLASLQTAESTR